MNLKNRALAVPKSFFAKAFVVVFSFNIICVFLSGFSNNPFNNVSAISTTLHAQTNHGNTYTLNARLSEDSTTIFYNMGWEAYKKNNYNSARYYWEKGSLSANDTPDKFNCLFRLGLLQQVGEGVNINLEAAFNFYMKASNNGKPGGNVDATKNIGTFYENGMYVKKDNKKALEWYTKAKEQGNKYCEDDITRVKKNMYDLFEDINKSPN